MIINVVKKYLKRNALIYAANARFKSLQTAHRLGQLRRKYEEAAALSGLQYSKGAAIEKAKVRISAHVPAKPLSHERLRILWAGANWNQDNSGFLRTLERYGEVTYFKNIKGDYGWLYVRDKGPIMIYDKIVVEMNDLALIKQVESLRKNGPLHVLIGQMWANFVSVNVLQTIQRMGVITINISMDDRLPEHWRDYKGIRLGSVGLCNGLDLVLTSSPECCLFYTVEGCPSIYWPMASDPARFKTYPEDQKKYDITFIGNRYGLRGKIVDRLLKAGIPVTTFGAGWPNGTVDADQSAEIFGRSRIILGVGNIAYNDDIFTLKLRDFDATMAGALYITHRNSDLSKLFDEGKEIEFYLSIDECIRKIRFYLDHPVERMAIAKAAAERARREHTWDHRLNEVFTMLDIMAKTSEMK